MTRRVHESKPLPTLHEPESITRGRDINRRIRRENAREDKAATEARKEGWNLDAAQSETVKVLVNESVVLMDRMTAYALIRARQAKLAVDLDAKVDFIATEEGAA